MGLIRQLKLRAIKIQREQLRRETGIDPSRSIPSIKESEGFVTNDHLPYSSPSKRYHISDNERDWEDLTDFAIKNRGDIAVTVGL